MHIKRRMSFRLPISILIFLFPLHLLRLSAQSQALQYTCNAADTMFGKVISDPYRWMENLYSDSVQDWLDAEEDITKSTREAFGPRLMTARGDIRNHGGQYLRAVEKTGPWYFRIFKDPRFPDQMPFLFYREEDDKNFQAPFDPRTYKLAYDPNIPHDDTKYIITQWSLSDNNRYLAVMVSPVGTDWREIRVHDMESGKDFPDRLRWIKFSNIVWWRNGFFYTRFMRPEKELGQTGKLSGQQLYYHQLGHSQDEDKLIAAASGKATETIKFQKTSNDRYLLINLQQKIKGEWSNVIVYKDLEEGLSGELKPVVGATVKSEVMFTPVDFIDSSFVLMTNLGASHNRVVSCPLDTPNIFKEVIPAYDKVLQEVHHIHHELLAVYFTAGKYELHSFDYRGNLLGSTTFGEGIEVHGFSGKPDDTECTFYANTFYMPTVAYRYYFHTHQVKVIHETYINYNQEDYTTTLVKYHSKDGTEVPMYLTYKKGVKITGDNPVLLYGVGVIGQSAKPFFKYSHISLFNNNGILAVPMIRGGDEMGQEWRDSGQRENKQNACNDFIAAAEYLISSGYTSKERLAIMCNGGSLVGAVLAQRPDLCQVAISRVGTFDLLRFNQFTGGRFWTAEYGSPDDSADFKTLFKYSPLHNLRPNTAYPATLLITADNDDRVPAFHTYKFLATLQKYNSGNKPQILFFEEDAGHNGSFDYIDRNYEDAFTLAFIYSQMNIRLKQ